MLAAETKKWTRALRSIASRSTVRLPALATPEAGAGSEARAPSDFDAPVALVGAGLESLAAATNRFRADRLRAASLFLILTMLALLVWRLVIGWDDLGWALLGLIAIQVGIPVALSEIPPTRTRWLTAVEVLMFGSVLVYIGMRQYSAMLAAYRHGSDVVALLAAFKNGLVGAMLLMATYAMLIPSTWRRAGVMVLAALAASPASYLALALRHPEAWRFIHAYAPPERLGENVLVALASAGLAVYGVAVLNRLRREAFVGRRLNQYRLRERIGVGGMGEVYLADHRLLKRPCALKVIRAHVAEDPEALARFEREVQETAALSHPNIVAIYDYGHTDEGLFYYVMEYLRGLTLHDLVKRHGPLPPGRVIHLLRQACGALAEAHAAGLIHRDLKPANLFAAVLGGQHDFIKLLDFGLVKRLDQPTADPRSPEATQLGRVRGTPQFMAPEQALGAADLDARCDLYALGGIAYFLLTGQPAFDGDSSMELMIAQVHKPVEPPSQRRAGIPADLEAVVMRCLAKKPDDRYPGAADLERALAACADATHWGPAEANAWWAEHETL